MGTPRGEIQPVTPKWPRYWWVAALLSLLVIGVVLERLIQARPAKPLNGAPVIVRRETRPTLDPALFVGKARAAHQVARGIPDVLDQLYCYCQCDKSAGHKSLLSCFTDGHAAT